MYQTYKHDDFLCYQLRRIIQSLFLMKFPVVCERLGCFYINKETAIGKHSFSSFYAEASHKRVIARDLTILPSDTRRLGNSSQLRASTVLHVGTV